MKFSDIKFARNHNEEFYKVLRQRVNEYFKENNITRYNHFYVFSLFHSFCSNAYRGFKHMDVFWNVDLDGIWYGWYWIIGYA